MRVISWLTTAGMGLLALGCAGDKQAPAAGRASMAERFGGGSPMVFSQDEQGGWQPPQADKRSTFEIGDRDNPMFKGQVDRKSFHTTKEVERRAWSGAPQVAKPAFAGTPEAGNLVKRSPWDGRQDAAATATAREAGNRFATGRFATGTAREAQARRLDHPLDALTEERRDVYQEPEVRNWQQQRGISLGDTKSMLGGN